MFGLYGKWGMTENNWQPLVAVWQFENEKFKFEKWFIVLKNENHFIRIKQDFMVKPKNVFSLTIIFQSTKHLKITYFFQKQFYAETMKLWLSQLHLRNIHRLFLKSVKYWTIVFNVSRKFGFQNFATLSK
jgi:hypothetical protein